MKYEVKSWNSQVTVTLIDLPEDGVLVSGAGRRYRPQTMTVKFYKDYVGWIVHSRLIRKADGQLSDTWMDFRAAWQIAEGSLPVELFDQMAQEIAEKMAPAQVDGETQQAKERVKAFLEARKVHKALDPEDIAGIGGNNGIAYLTVSDLKKLVGEK